MIKTFINIIALSPLLLSTPAHAFTKLFYAFRDSDIPNLRDHYRVLSDIEKHHKKIDILVPQAYVINPEGRLYEFVEPEFLQMARHHSIKLMPLVTNENFNSEKVDTFLKDNNAQKLAINNLTQVCKTNHYYGLQIDFEHIPAHDRNAFTNFYIQAANALHTAKCKISVALIPERHNIPPSKLLLNRSRYWSGAYDQKKLGNISDFVVLMTYNQNGGATTPGPTATVPIDKEAIEYALKYIPRYKLFLGIPTTSIYWVINPIERSFKHTHLTFDEQPVSSMIAHGVGISYQQVQLLQRRHHLKWQWDNYAKTHYAIFHYQDFYRYVFAEDADSIAAKQKLAKHYHLGGIAVFRLGNEDPKMWNQAV